MSFRPIICSTLCFACAMPFEAIPEVAVCPDCGRADSPERCADCLQWQSVGEYQLMHRGLYRYNDAMRDLMHQYKGLGDYRLRTAFAREVQQFRQLRATFVPLTSEPGHVMRRGFDPVLGLFATLPLKCWLVKSDTDSPQAKKLRAERLLTPQSFRCVVPVATLNRVRRICLLDDVYTTGRTLHHAANALRDAGYTGHLISRSLIR